MTQHDEIVAEASHRRASLLAEVFGFLSHTKKWWLAPIIVCMFGLGLLIFLGSTAAAPFIYTLF